MTDNIIPSFKIEEKDFFFQRSYFWHEKYLKRQEVCG